ncbi:hypothetical protein N9250_00965 [bacterium]|nr:hypothetical protein [bacterium]
MTKKRKRRKPEQIAKLMREGQVMLAAGKSEGVEFLRRFQKLPEKDASNASRSHLISQLPHSSTLKCLPGLCVHLFTCRLHLGVAALGMGTPVTGFPYQGKFEEQFELFNLSNDGLIYPDALPESSDEMMGLMKTRYEQGELLRKQINERLPAVKAFSYKNFDGIVD